jgi:citrate synthase
MNTSIEDIRRVIEQAANKARSETSNEPEPEFTSEVKWPITCTVGPGLEGAIACESKVGFVNGAKGWLIYRGYDIFDLCAYSTYEEVSYLLLHGNLPGASELRDYKTLLTSYRNVNKTLRRLMSIGVEELNAMASLRMGTNLMRRDFTRLDLALGRPGSADAIGADEDSIAMETVPRGEAHAIYEFKQHKNRAQKTDSAEGLEACYHMIAAMPTIAAAIARTFQGKMPVEPDPELGHAANFLYMLTGKRPTPLEERVMDIALILHADHGMNASTFAAMVTASTLSDIYLSIGSGIAALSGPLHGGANEEVMIQLQKIGSPENAEAWVEQRLNKKKKISGFGHRVYKAYDPRARVLGPMAAMLVKGNPDAENLFATARAVESAAGARLGADKKIFPNVDFYSGIVYQTLGIRPEMFTPIFAVSRVAGWVARVHEYLQTNRIYRPRAMYSGPFNLKYEPIDKR